MGVQDVTKMLPPSSFQPRFVRLDMAYLTLQDLASQLKKWETLHMSSH